jgi:hypothetical protein
MSIINVVYPGEDNLGIFLGNGNFLSFTITSFRGWPWTWASFLRDFGECDMPVKDGELMRWNNGMTLSLGEVIASIRADRDGARRGIDGVAIYGETSYDSYLTVIFNGSVYESENQINLKFDNLARDPRLEPLVASGEIRNPETDGGPDLSEDEIFELLLRPSCQALKKD